MLESGRLGRQQLAGLLIGAEREVYDALATVPGAGAVRTGPGGADAVGRDAREHLEQWLPPGPDFDADFLGPKPFMAFIRRTLAERGLPAHRSRYEFFGPAEALA